ncbi:hypothetical protein [Bacillus wiedmannii]
MAHTPCVKQALIGSIPSQTIIGLVMHLLNHSSESMTLTYLGLDQASRETMLDQIDFG